MKKFAAAAGLAVALGAMSAAPVAHARDQAAPTAQTSVQVLAANIVAAAKQAEAAAQAQGLSPEQVQAQVEAAVFAVIAQSGMDTATVKAALAQAGATEGLSSTVTAALAGAAQVVADAGGSAPGANNGNKGRSGSGGNTGNGGPPIGPPPGSGSGGGGSDYRPAGH
jgi:hypothetical protein